MGPLHKREDTLTKEEISEAFIKIIKPILKINSAFKAIQTTEDTTEASQQTS